MCPSCGTRMHKDYDAMASRPLNAEWVRVQQAMDELTDQARQQIIGSALTTVDKARAFTSADMQQGSISAKVWHKRGAFLDWQEKQWTERTDGICRVVKYLILARQLDLGKVPVLKKDEHWPPKTKTEGVTIPQSSARVPTQLELDGIITKWTPKTTNV